MALVRYNYGYRLSNFSTLHLVNSEKLAVELLLREIECEVPKCDSMAGAVLRSGVTALVCLRHEAEHKSGQQKAKAIEDAVKFTWQGIMAVAAELAYKGSEKHVTTLYDGQGSLLDSARSVMNGNPPLPLFGLLP